MKSSLLAIAAPTKPQEKHSTLIPKDVKPAPELTTLVPAPYHDYLDVF
jgi:hypothetical protein